MKSKLIGGVVTVLFAMTVVGCSSDSASSSQPEPYFYFETYAKSAPTKATQVVLTKEQKAAESPIAMTQFGFLPSLYRGVWYDPSAENYRRCIMKRESNFNYKARNKTSSAQGAYQFLDNNWRDGLVWMMLKESKKEKDGLKKEIKKLRKKRIQKWNRYFQDRAFYTAWQFGKGKHHWNATVPGTGCW